MATTDYATFQKVDENNEVIIAEAVCDRTKVCMRVCCIYYAIAVFSFLIFLPCALVLGVFLGRKAAVEWRLYLDHLYWIALHKSRCLHLRKSSFVYSSQYVTLRISLYKSLFSYKMERLLHRAIV